MWRVKRPLHSSWQIAALAVGIFVGVILAPMLSITWIATLAWFLTGVLLCLIAVTKQTVYMVPFAIAGGLIIGLWRGTAEQTALEAYQPLINTTLTIEGTVSDDRDTDKSGNTVLRLKEVMYRGYDLPGKIWVTLSSEAPVERSDRVTLHGKLQPGFGTFPAAMYRAELIKTERPQPGDIALHVRDWFADAVRTAVPEPEASLGVGYLVGQRRNLPEDLDMALKTAGLTHIVVASGYNLTILVRLARRLFEKISKYLSALAAGGMIVSFVAITGASPSMSRAGLIAALSLLAWYYGRKFHPLVLLPIAVATTVLINPSYAWGDVGWQLSFAAFAGVMLLAPLLQAYYFGPKKPGVIRQIFGETVSAWICTLPILLLAFGQISNVAIFANLLILPLVPLAMLLTFMAGIGALVAVPLATIVGFPAYALLSYMTQTAQFMAHLPWATSEFEAAGWQVALMYAALISFGIYMWRKTRLNLRDTNIVE